MAWRIGRYSRSRSGRSAARRSGWGSSTRESAGYAAPGRSPSHTLTRPPRCFCTWRRACCTPGRGQHQSALDSIRGGSASAVATHRCPLLSRRGLPAGSRPRRFALGCRMRRAQRSAGFSAEPERMGMGAIYNARAVICIADGDPATALDVLREVRDITPPAGPAFTLVEAHLLAGTAHLRLGDRNAAAAAAEAALAAAEPDRLIFPFAMTEAAELLDALPRHETAHGALLADIVDLLRGASAPHTDREPPIATGRAQPQRATRTAISADKPDAAGDRARALRLHQHGQHAHPQRLCQARCARSLCRRSTRTASCGSSQPALLNIAEVARAPACAQSPDSGVAGSLGRAAR